MVKVQIPSPNAPARSVYQPKRLVIRVIDTDYHKLHPLIMVIFLQRKYFNQRLALSCSLIALSSFNYGFDNQAFATTQAMNAFTKQFGDYNAKKKTYALDPVWLSLFNSLVYIGFGAGKYQLCDISSLRISNVL